MRSMPRIWTLRASLALVALAAGVVTINSCKNPDEMDPNLGFRLFDVPNSSGSQPNARVVQLDPRFRQGEDEFQRFQLERLRLSYFDLQDVLDEIAGAQSTLDITSFALSSQSMTNTLVGLAARGVQVRVVTENGQFSSIAPAPTGQPDPEALLVSLQQAGVEVRVDPDDLNRGMNARYAIIDNRLVIVGSADLLSQHFYDVANGDIRGRVNSVMMFDSSRTLQPGGGQAQVTTLLDAFAFDFEEMFIRGRFGTAKETMTKTSFDIGVPVEVYFGPKADIREELIATIINSDVRSSWSIGELSDGPTIGALANTPVPSTGVVDGFLTPAGIDILGPASQVPVSSYLYAGPLASLNVMNHQFYAADFPTQEFEFTSQIPGRDPVVFMTSGPWTARSFDSDDSVAVRIHHVGTSVRYNLEYETMVQATGNTGGQPTQGPPPTVLVFGEVRSAANNAPLEASVIIRSEQVSYLPGDQGMPITVDSDPDTGQYFAFVPAGEITIDVGGIEGPFSLPPTIRQAGVKFPGGSEEENFYLPLINSGTSGSGGGG